MTSTPAKSGTRDEFSPANIRPEDFEYVGSFYVGVSDEISAAFAETNAETHYEMARLTGQARPFTCKCDHCGQHFAYGAVFHRVSDHHLLMTGHVCAQNTMTYPDKAALDLDKLTRRVAAARKTANLSKKVAAFVVKYPGLEASFKVDHPIISDIFAKLQHYGTISENQVGLVNKIAQQVAERAVQNAQRLATAKPVVAGKQEITGTIISFKEVESAFGGYGTVKYVTKMLVQLEDGSRVFGTCPASILGVAKGSVIKFSATVEPSKDDQFFGFFSRPNKAEILKPAIA